LILNRFMHQCKTRILNTFLYTLFPSLMMPKKKSLCIEGEALELLKQLLQNGFVYTGKNRNMLRFLPLQILR
ncbi:MAG: hypothetical protein KAQ84_04535, partial [Thermoplasmatales archaeon]|nr:hypothetical protein [Thermoplasmatales archaeon]